MYWPESTRASPLQLFQPEGTVSRGSINALRSFRPEPPLTPLWKATSAIQVCAYPDTRCTNICEDIPATYIKSMHIYREIFRFTHMHKNITYMYTCGFMNLYLIFRVHISTCPYTFGTLTISKDQLPTIRNTTSILGCDSDSNRLFDKLPSAPLGPTPLHLRKCVRTCICNCIRL